MSSVDASAIDMRLTDERPSETASADIASLAFRLTDNLRGQVEQANQKLAHYAAELKGLAERELEKSQKLEELNAQLTAYARELEGSMERERQRSIDLENAYLDMVKRLIQASALRDTETGEHIQRLGHYSRVLALEAGCTLEQANLLAAAAPMHDLGKIGVPDRVLQKEGALSQEEWACMRMHPLIGASLLAGSDNILLRTSRVVAMGHHERWDGTGYPHGLKGEAIPFAARIVAIADAYDALRNARSYKPGYTHEQTCRILLEGDGRTQPEHFDPRLLAIFARIHEKFAAIFDGLREARIHDPMTQPLLDIVLPPELQHGNDQIHSAGCAGGHSHNGAGLGSGAG